MINLTCGGCGKKWEDFYLTHEIGIENLEDGRFSATPQPGLPEEEMVEGHLMILSCPFRNIGRTPCS